MPNYVAALDVGTTGTRTVIFNLEGKEIARHYEEWASIYPSPVMVEQDANQWWTTTRATIDEALQKGKIDPKDILGVACTNQRETIVPVDETGTPLANAIVWQDRRSTAECEILKEEFGTSDIYDITGLTVDPYFSAPKILWFKNNQPKIYEKTYKFLLVHDFIVHKLTGRFVTDYTNASRTMLFNIERLKWSSNIAESVDLDIDKMPGSGSLRDRRGGNHRPGRDRIRPGNNGGCGRRRPASGGLSAWASWNLAGLCAPPAQDHSSLNYLESPQFDPQRRVLCSCHADGHWVQEASIFTTGAVYRWIRDTIAHPECANAEQDGRDPYEVIGQSCPRFPRRVEWVCGYPPLHRCGNPVLESFNPGVNFRVIIGKYPGRYLPCSYGGRQFRGPGEFIRFPTNRFYSRGPPRVRGRCTIGFMEPDNGRCMWHSDQAGRTRREHCRWRGYPCRVWDRAIPRSQNCRQFYRGHVKRVDSRPYPSGKIRPIISTVAENVRSDGQRGYLPGTRRYT